MGCLRTHTHTHRVTEIVIDKVVHQALKKPSSFEGRGTTGVCLGHDNRISGGVLVVSVVNGTLREVCSAKARRFGEKGGQSWKLHIRDSSTRLHQGNLCLQQWRSQMELV